MFKSCIQLFRRPDAELTAAIKHAQHIQHTVEVTILSRGYRRIPECLDKLLIINQAHLRRVMCEYVAFFNTARPHQGIEQQIPVPQTRHHIDGLVRCRNVLGGILHDYYRDAA